MSIDTVQFIEQIITPTLRELDDYIPVSLAAMQLLLGTAAQESNMGKYLTQVGGGPALGVYQMEVATHEDIWKNYLAFREPLVRRIERMLNTSIVKPHDWLTPSPDRLIWDMRYATIMARVHYRRVPEALPREDDLYSQGKYWKNHYNTHAGRGKVGEYIINFNRVTQGLAWIPKK